MSTAPLLELDHVSRQYQDGPRTIAALDDVSLTVSPGELVAIMGPSGSGKSTLLNVAGTLDAPTSGRVLIRGANPAELSAKGLAELRCSQVGFVFQHFNLIPTLTVAENIALPLELGGMGSSEARRHAMAALDELELSDIASAFPSEVSGGQAQRVAVSRALVGSRSLLLADEPTGALDTVAGENVLGLIRSRVDSGAACLLVTHEPRFAAYAHRVVYLRDGRVTDSEER